MLSATITLEERKHSVEEVYSQRLVMKITHSKEFIMFRTMQVLHQPSKIMLLKIFPLAMELPLLRGQPFRLKTHML